MESAATPLDPASAGARLATPRLADVAARAGVSNSTVSLVFSGTGPVADATRARVLAAAAELGYAGPDPRARSLRRGRSGIVAVVLEDTLSDSFRDPMNLSLLDGIAEAFGDAQLSLLLIAGAADDAARIATAPLDAAVLIGCSTQLDSSIEVLLRRRVPVVAVEAPHVEGVVPIDLDNFEAAALGAQHLRDLGHDRVAVVTLPLGADRRPAELTPQAEAASTAVTARERIRGTRSVYPDAVGRAARGSSIEEGLAAGRALLAPAAGERPTAVIAQSDLLAVGVIRAAEERGLEVPGDLSVIGFDGVRLDGATAHTLTTLVQPAREKGVATGRAVLAALAGEPALPALFTSELRVGTTSAPPRTP